MLRNTIKFFRLASSMSFRLWLADLSSQADALAYRGSKDATHREHAAGEMRGGTREISRAIGVKNWQHNYVCGFFINAISGRWHRLHLYGFEASSIAANCIQKTAGPRAKVTGHGI
ncbi:uncharacterized protein [Bombus flavifrons]|uniref:uncharacterized protein isoform X2 n=1 Tax=Bombus flavifrons TaxID=103934 RepID=UPI003703A2DD